jgi:hypothetical protein
MVYPEIKIKEKRKSFTMKVIISKEDVQGELFTQEDVTELKKTILEDVSYNLDELIVMMVEDEELGEDQILGLEKALEKVTISVGMIDFHPLSENEVIEEVEEVEETDSVTEEEV